MKKIIILFIALSALWSCSGILEQEPVGPRTDAAYWKTEADMQDAIAGTYEVLISSSRSLGMHDLFFDNQGDDHWRAGDHSQDEEIETHNTMPDNYKIRNPYTDKYEMVSRANGIIINGPKVLELGTISQATYDNIMGEAYFCRAWAYYRLLVIQGQVPLILEANVLENNYNVPKVDSPDIIRNQVISDLETALTLLPLDNDAGRAHKGAAWALLCKAYLHGAEDLNDPSLSKVIEYGEQVITNFPIHTDYLELFRTGCEVLPEWLWGMMNDEVWLNRRYMTKHRGPRPWGMYSFQEPLDDLVNEYEAGDIRHKSTVIDDGDTVYLGADYGWQEHTANLSQTGHSYFKYMQWKDDGSFVNWIPVAYLRSGETYMNVAEAKIRLNGAGAGDTEINAIRARAGLAPISGGDMAALMHESRCEEAGENMRYQNLLRWHKAELINLESWFSATPEFPAKLYPDDIGRKIFQAPKDYYQPLPQLDIDNSGGVLIQNPLWTAGGN